MENDLAKMLEIESREDKTIIRPVGSINDISLVPSILQAFMNCFRKKQYFLSLDCSQIEVLTPAFTALLFEVTAKARRHGGDVEIVNLSKGSRKSLDKFNPLDYLTVIPHQYDAENTVVENSKTPVREVFLTPQTPSPVHARNSSKSIQIPSKPESIYKACDFVISIATKVGVPHSELGKIKIAVYEACLNAIEHAYRSDPSETILVDVDSDNSKLTIEIIDTGAGFTKSARDPYDVIEAASKRKTGGMGLHIIRRSMDDVRYESDPIRGNRLIMIKNIVGESQNIAMEK